MERPTRSPLHSQSTEPSPIPIHGNHLLHNPSLDSLSTLTALNLMEKWQIS